MHFSADFSDAVLTKIAKHIGHERRRLAALLGLGPPTIDQIEQNHAGVSKKINLAILQVLALLWRSTFCCETLFYIGVTDATMTPHGKSNIDTKYVSWS